MNQCKAKKLLWRMNKSVARDLLPSEPLAVQVQPWHLCCVVNLSASLSQRTILAFSPLHKAVVRPPLPT